MKKTSSQTIIHDKKKPSIIQTNIPFIEGLNNGSQKNGWENQQESPLDERKIYRKNNIEDSGDSPSQIIDGATPHKNSLSNNKPALNNNFVADNLIREESRKDIIKLRHITTISDRNLNEQDKPEKDRQILPKPPEIDRFDQPSQDWQKGSFNNKSMKNDKSKIIPGYMKNCIDDNNPDHNSVKGLFSEGEIKEAFDTLDMNKNGHITAEDLAFFLDVLEEEVQEEEIEEMIRLCDIEGNGKVKYEEFQRMASGTSLAPIGQAYPPTFQMIERKKQLETMELKQNNSLMKNEFFKNLDENSMMSKKFEYDSIDNVPINKTKFFKGDGDKASKMLSNEKKKQKKEYIETFVKQHGLVGKELIRNIENLKQIDVNIILECDYISFLKYFGLNEDNEVNKNAFYVLVDNEEKNINLKYSVVFHSILLNFTKFA